MKFLAVRQVALFGFCHTCLMYIKIGLKDRIKCVRSIKMNEFNLTVVENCQNEIAYGSIVNRLLHLLCQFQHLPHKVFHDQTVYSKIHGSNHLNCSHRRSEKDLVYPETQQWKVESDVKNGKKGSCL